MLDLLLVFAGPLVVSLVLTRLMRTLAVRCKAIDRPDGWRKLHKQPVPLWGGVAVFAALVVGVCAARLAPVQIYARVDQLSTTLLFSGGLIFLLGFLDDRFDLRGRLKLLLQFVAVTPVILGGYWVEEIGLFNQTVHLGWLGIPFTMFWLVGAVNALNLLDGMDGNASTVGVIACGAVAAIAGRHGLDEVVLLSLAMAGAILGFLVYNLPSASIYLGDAGSTVIGLVVGFLCLQGARDGNDVLRITAPLVVLTVPILDSSLAIVRRKLAGRRFDHADRGHIHHRLLERGFNAWQALAIMGLLCLVSAAAATVATYLDNEPLAWLTALILVVALAQFRYFGHHEFVLARRLISMWRTNIFNRLAFRSHRARWWALSRLPTATFNEAWYALTSEVAHWPADRLEMCVWREDRPIALHTWRKEGDEPESVNRWRLVLTFGPRAGTRCELLVVGIDYQSREPSYLAHLASVLRVYGRYWLHHPERVDVQEVASFAPQVGSDIATNEKRHAA